MSQCAVGQPAARARGPLRRANDVLASSCEISGEASRRRFEGAEFGREAPRATVLGRAEGRAGMRCPACQHEGAPGANFCAACGTRLVYMCRACGTELPESARFCLQCGQSVSDATSAASPRFTIPKSYTPRHTAERILASKNAAEGERKLLTVLFADLEGLHGVPC